ncbi:MAG TPA: hypothetical protein VNG51_19470 [Ktedonobacteraceae bacterium]|nr:hypothetical protein [Ktedonobacteraceae bacterium]
MGNYHGEWVGNLGYAMFVTETIPGTAVLPSVATLLTDETMTTAYNLEQQDVVFGNPAGTYQVLPGLRDHKGDITIVAEPNTAAQVADCLLTRGSVTGSGPYTWPFTLNGLTAPNSKTLEVSLGGIVKRFVGVQCSKLTMTQSKNQIMLKPSFSALGSFQTGVIASVSGSGPYTIVFDTTYDASPTTKLVAADLIRGYHAGSAYIDGTIATIVNATTITTAANMSSLVAGDTISLRPQTPSFTLLTPFLWSNTQFCAGATAAAALSATQTRLEQGSTWELDYSFESDSGSQLSGSADPFSLRRTVGGASLNVKRYFDTPDDVIKFNQQSKTAWVVRHFAGSTNQYELRVTFNHLKTDDPMPKVKSKGINFSDIKYKSQYDTSDAQMFALTNINGLATIA